MPTYRIKNTPETIEKRIKQGRGSGELKTYIPWILVHEISSHGISHNPLGNTTKREHHLLSDGEEKLFTILDHIPIFTDIREQYPLLPQADTLHIAKQLGIEHPTDKQTGCPYVMTTDFLITVENHTTSYLALSSKYANVIGTDEGSNTGTLENLRTLELLEIERLFWKARDIPFFLVTDKDIPDPVYWNIKQCIRPHYELPKRITQRDMEAASRYMTKRIVNTNLSLLKIADSCDKAQKFERYEGISLAIAFHMIATHQWEIDLYERIDTTKPLGVRSVKPELLK